MLAGAGSGWQATLIRKDAGRTVVGRCWQDVTDVGRRYRRREGLTKLAGTSNVGRAYIILQELVDGGGQRIYSVGRVLVADDHRWDVLGEAWLGG